MDQGAVILLSLKGLRLIDLNDMKWNVEIPFRRLILLIGKETNLHRSIHRLDCIQTITYKALFDVVTRILVDFWWFFMTHTFMGILLRNVGAWPLPLCHFKCLLNYKLQWRRYPALTRQILVFSSLPNERKMINKADERHWRHWIPWCYESREQIEIRPIGCVFHGIM